MTDFSNRDATHKFTEKLSDFNRQLAFAALAIIWIFKIQYKNRIAIPDDLMFPLICFLVSLALDLTQYLYQSIAWTIFHRTKEKEIENKNAKLENKINPDTEIIESLRWISNIAYWIFVLKVAANIIGYSFLLFRIYQ